MARRLLASLLALVLVAPALAGAQAVPPPPPGQPPAPPDAALADAPAPEPTDPEITPARISYLHGSVSFWRPGADDWTPAVLNTPLAPGDALYTAPGAAVEVQIGPHSFVRASQGTQLGLDNQETDFTQLRVTAGNAIVDVGDLPPGASIELATPTGAFTLEQPGYYRVDVTADWTALAVHGSGRASVTTATGAAAAVSAGQQALLVGADAPRLELRAAPALDAWDRWNQTRTAQLRQSPSARYVGSAVYGAEALDQHGAWHVEQSYGAVWVPAGVPAGWVPYSTGRWIWDPRFGWTWLDDAPWGWAPYHHGRWVFVRGRWAWAPGPVVVRPVYAPALVVFLGARVVGRPLCWAPLGWGEPVVPWWGRPGFIGRVTWVGWGGPRVVNNVVIDRTTTVNVTNITVYRNVQVTNAVVGVPADRFGRGPVRPTRIAVSEARQLQPVRGAPRVKPVAASVAPARERAVAPPPAVRQREVVATRRPHDPTPSLRAAGLPATAAEAPAPRPTRVVAPPAGRAAPGREDKPGAQPRAPAARGDRDDRDDARRPGDRRPGGDDGRGGARGQREGHPDATQPARGAQQPGRDAPGREGGAPARGARPGERDALPGAREGQPGDREVPQGARGTSPGERGGPPARGAQPGDRDVPPALRGAQPGERVAPPARGAQPGDRDVPQGPRGAQPGERGGPPARGAQPPDRDVEQRGRGLQQRDGDRQQPGREAPARGPQRDVQQPGGPMTPPRPDDDRRTSPPPRPGATPGAQPPAPPATRAPASPPRPQAAPAPPVRPPAASPAAREQRDVPGQGPGRQPEATGQPRQPGGGVREPRQRDDGDRQPQAPSRPPAGAQPPGGRSRQPDAGDGDRGPRDPDRRPGRPGASNPVSPPAAPPRAAIPVAPPAAASPGVQSRPAISPPAVSPLPEPAERRGAVAAPAGRRPDSRGAESHASPRPPRRASQHLAPAPPASPAPRAIAPAARPSLPSAPGNSSSGREPRRDGARRQSTEQGRPER